MKFFEITNNGLAAIAVLTVVLWSVLLMERNFNRSAMRDYEELQRSWQIVPVAQPEAESSEFAPKSGWVEVS